jgi:lipopolysaccharide export system permease protein
VNLGELAWRLGLLIGSANLLLLGIGTAATNPRRPSNWNLLFALLAFMVYFNLVNLSQAWIGAGRVQMLPTLLTLHGSALVLALALIWWRDNGTTRSGLARARPAPASAAAPAAAGGTP